MCRSAGCTWKFPMKNWPAERGHGRCRDALDAAGTDFFTTTFCRQIGAWISISWLAKVARRFHGITISRKIQKVSARLLALASGCQRIGNFSLLNSVCCVLPSSVATRRPLPEIRPPSQAYVSTSDATFDLPHSDKLWRSLRPHPCWRPFRLSGSLLQSRISDSPRRARPYRWTRRLRDILQDPRDG